MHDFNNYYINHSGNDNNAMTYLGNWQNYRAGGTIARRRLSLAAATFAFAGIAAAAASAQETTIVTFTARAETNLVRDRLVADLAVEATDADAARLQGAINRRMTAALARAKAVPAVTVATGGYSVYEERPDKAPPLSHGQQSLHLEAQDQAALLGLAGTLQADGLALTSLTATLSHDAARAVEDRLTDEALQRVRVRAAKVAAALGLHVARLRTLHIGSVEAPPAPVRAFAMAMAARAAPPVAAPGEAVVGVTVEAEVELSPPH